MIERIAKFSRVLKFGAVGAVNTLVDFLVFTLCSELGLLAPARAQTAGYLAGIVCSFVLNRTFTFSDAARVTGAAAVGRWRALCW
jgi:putative flippase GtrA